MPVSSRYLHCVSAYPTPADEAQLRVIPTLADRLGVTAGYSDHVAGIDAALPPSRWARA